MSYFHPYILTFMSPPFDGSLNPSVVKWSAISYVLSQDVC